MNDNLNRHHITDERLSRYFSNDIIPQIFSGSTPTKNPTFVLIGGQPASGKTNTQNHFMKENPNTVKLDRDDLRQFHPDYSDLVRYDPLGMPDATDQASGQWTRMAIEYARENSYSLLLGNTFRSPQTCVNTAAEFARAGYRVQVAALAVSQERSRLDTVGRYLMPGKEAARWLQDEPHEAAYPMVPATLRQLERSPHTHTTIVTNRSGEQLYRNSRDPTGSWRQPPQADAVLHEERNRPWSPAEARDWYTRYWTCNTAAVDRGVLDERTLSRFTQLHHDADTVAATAFGQERDSPGWHQHHSWQQVQRYVLEARRDGTPTPLLPSSPQAFLTESQNLGAYLHHLRDRSAPTAAATTPIDRELHRRSQIDTAQARSENSLRIQVNDSTPEPAAEPTTPEPSGNLEQTVPPQPRRPAESSPERDASAPRDTTATTQHLRRVLQDMRNQRTTREERPHHEPPHPRGPEPER